MEKSFRRTVIDNGLVVISEEMKGLRSISLGFFTKRGARDEEPSKKGVTHFLEHMLFKGTKKRTAKEIASTLEDRGGGIDAITAKEFLSIFARFLDEDLEIAMDLLSDLVTSPLLDEKEVEREKGVILEEYRGFYDAAEDYVFHLLYRSMFDEHPLAYEILGTPETISQMRREDLFMRWRDIMNPKISFIAAAGNVSHEELVELSLKYFKIKPSQVFLSEENPLRKRPTVVKRVEERLQQTHVAMGTYIPPYRDERRYPVIVLNTILGTGMSSRLFQKLREKRGLVYSISSFLEYYRDIGVLGIYFCVEPRNLNAAYEAVIEEVESLRKEGISQEELEKTKTRVKGSLALNLESSSGRMTRIANQEIHLGKQISVEETLSRFEKVSQDDVREVIEEFLNPDSFAIGIMGPQEIEKWKPKE